MQESEFTRHPAGRYGAGISAAMIAGPSGQAAPSPAAPPAGPSVGTDAGLLAGAGGASATIRALIRPCRRAPRSLGDGRPWPATADRVTA